MPIPRETTAQDYKFRDKDAVIHRGDTLVHSPAPRVPVRDSSKDFSNSVTNIIQPRGLSEDAGFLYILDQTNDRVRAYNTSNKRRANGRELSRNQMTAASATINPNGISVSGNIIKIIDSTNNVVYNFNRRTKASSVAITRQQMSAANMSIFPTGLTENTDTIWVPDSVGKAIWAFNKSDGSRKSTSDFTNADIKVVNENINPRSCVVSGSMMWVGDESARAVWAFSFGSGGISPLPNMHITTAMLTSLGSRFNPEGLATDGTTIWVADSSGTGTVYAFTLPT